MLIANPALKHLLSAFFLIGTCLFAFTLTGSGLGTLYEDDFATALKVREFLETGRFSIHGFPLHPQIFQILWGSAVSLVCGYSVYALNISTAILSLAGVVFCYFTVYEITAARKQAIIFALFYLIFPAYLQHSLTFMSEIPFATLVLVSLFCFIRNNNSGSRIALWLCSFSLGLASLTRHHALFIALGFCAITFLRPGSFREKTVRAMTVMSVPALFSAAFLIFVWLTQPLGYSVMLKTTGFIATNAKEAEEMRSVFVFYERMVAAWTGKGYRIFAILTIPFLGLTVPLLLYFRTLIRDWLESNRQTLYRVMGLIFLIALFSIIAHYPALLFDSIAPRRSFIPGLTYNSTPVYYLLLLLAGLGLVFAVTRLLRRRGTFRFSAAHICLVAYGFYALGFLFMPVFFSNYFIPCVFPLVLIFFADLTAGIRINHFFAFFLIAIAGFLSINFVNHQRKVDVLLWQKGVDYAAAYGTEHISVASLAWLGYHRYGTVESSLGYASPNVSLWDDVLNSPPPHVLVSRTSDLAWYDTPHYFPTPGNRLYRDVVSFPGDRQKYRKTTTLERIEISSIFLHDSVVVLRKE